MNPESESTTQEKKEERKLICPECKLLYEKMTFCIRCGAALVGELPSQQEELKPPVPVKVKAEEPKAEFAAAEWTKNQKPKTGESSQFKKELLRSTSPLEIKKERVQVQPPEKRPIERLLEDTDKKISSPAKGKKRFLRLSYEALTISFLCAVGLFLAWSAYSHFVGKPPASKPSRSEEPAGLVSSNASPSAPQTTAPVGESKAEGPIAQSSTPNESQEIEGINGLLSTIREANLRKNIELFMSCYSMDFKDREEKEKATLETWQNFNYLDLSYALKNCSISGNTAQARVEWSVKFYLREGSRNKENKTVLDVKFIKEKEGWKIKETTPIG